MEQRADEKHYTGVFLDRTTVMHVSGKSIMVRLYRLQMALALLILAILNTGCLYPNDRDELIGTYVAEYTFGTDTLELKSDGTYTQEITLKEERKVLRGDGRWTYDQTSHYIRFEDLYVLSDGYGNKHDDYKNHPRGLASLPPERYFWSRRLRLGPDEGAPYNKQ